MAYELSLPLVTERLTLRALGPDDASFHAALFGRPEVVRYLYDDVLTGEPVLAHLAQRYWHGLPDEGEFVNLGVAFEGRLIGEVGLGLTSRAYDTYEIGYVFTPESGGQGLATEAVRALVDVVFTHLGAHRVVGCLDARNTASTRLLERLGFRHEALLVANEFVKGEWCDESTYAVLAQEWLARSPD